MNLLQSKNILSAAKTLADSSKPAASSQMIHTPLHILEGVAIYGRLQQCLGKAVLSRMEALPGTDKFQADMLALYQVIEATGMADQGDLWAHLSEERHRKAMVGAGVNSVDAEAVREHSFDVLRKIKVNPRESLL